MPEHFMKNFTDPKIFVYTRSGRDALGAYEKPVILPALSNNDPLAHAWTEAVFTLDTMAEHALFFTQLIPAESAPAQHKAAQKFYDFYIKLLRKVFKNPPKKRHDLKAFCLMINESLKPFIAYKAQMEHEQTNGTLRSLAWPLYFEHTRDEAERTVRRFKILSRAEVEYDKAEVTHFWSEIMEEHARFTAHLLDPDEEELISKSMKTSHVFKDIHDNGAVLGSAKALFTETSTVIESMMHFPETSAVLSAAESILDFKTKLARDVAAARVKSIIDPRLADHVRREAVKFIDEFRRAR